MSTTCNPYLGFNGNCREAMEFYAKALNGKLEIMPFSEAPMELPPEAADAVMHSCITFGDNAIIMGSDGMPGKDFNFGTNNSVSISCSKIDVAKGIFEALAEGGEITMPFAETFWGAQFGTLTDKFGVLWMVNAQLEGSYTK